MIVYREKSKRICRLFIKTNETIQQGYWVQDKYTITFLYSSSNQLENLVEKSYPQ